MDHSPEHETPGDGVEKLWYALPAVPTVLMALARPRRRLLVSFLALVAVFAVAREERGRTAKDMFELLIGSRRGQGSAE